MPAVSAFLTPYPAHRNGVAVRAIAVVVSEGTGTEPDLRFVVVDPAGQASLAGADELDFDLAIDAGREAAGAGARDDARTDKPR